MADIIEMSNQAYEARDLTLTLTLISFSQAYEARDQSEHEIELIKRQMKVTHTHTYPPHGSFRSLESYFDEMFLAHPSAHTTDRMI